MVDLVYPPYCGGCGQLGERWCPSCIEKATRLVTICNRCGDHISSGELCVRCSQDPPPFFQMRTWAAFTGPVREAIHKLKYKHDIGLGEALSRHLVELYDIQRWPIDLILPMPLSRTRLQERGYNQSSLLAMPMAFALDVPYKPTAIERIRNTRSQVGLSAKDRLENVKDAFEANGELVRDRTVLVIDDVATTGATIRACSDALLKAGAKQVYAMTFARAVLGDDHMPSSGDIPQDSQIVQSLY